MKFKDYLTILNAVSGFLGVVLALQGNKMALLYIAPALIFDFLDGRFARNSKPDGFGKELDSLSDAVSFAFAPAIIMMSLQPSALVFFAGIIYLCCGLTRLAKFNIQKQKNVFIGLPSPAAALITIVISLLNNAILTTTALVVTGVLMVSLFKIKKI